MQFEYAATVEYDLPAAELHAIRAGLSRPALIRLDPFALEFRQLRGERCQQTAELMRRVDVRFLQ
jgi:hypothetical protein